MRIVVTGAGGFVGRSLVPLLAKSGAELLLVGRDMTRLHALLPRWPCCTYEDMASCAIGFDLVVHLAVLNNATKASDAEYDAINVEFLLKVAQRAREAGIGRFINISTVHALDLDNPSGYARSKRKAMQRLTEIEGIDTETVYLAAVTGDTFAGRLSVLNGLPRWLLQPALTAVAALRPTVSVDRLAAFILYGSGRNLTGDTILVNDQSENPVFRGCKRLMDVGVAILIIVLLWWALLLIWLIVKATSPGPGIFAQERVGKNGRPFICYKFRTMKTGTPQVGTHEVSASTVTGFGRFLRNTKLDEFPQAWNLLRNEISLVGPRPCLPVQTELLERRRQAGVLSVKPGITGLAQIKSVDMSNPARLVNWDARYLALRSLLLDLRIILYTATGRGQGDKVAD